MPRRYITDLRHGLDHDGQPAREPREAAELFRCLGNVAAAAHFAGVGEIVPTVLRCFTPRRRGTCRGALDARLESDGTVDWIEHLGDQNHLHVTVKGHRLITLAETDTPLQKGDGVSIHLRAPLFFDGNGNRIGR